MVMKPSKPLYPEIKAVFTGPIVVIILLFILGDLLQDLGIGAYAAQWVEANTFITMAVIWFIWKVVNIWRARRRLRYEAEGRTDAAVLGRPVATRIEASITPASPPFWMVVPPRTGVPTW